MEFVYAQQELRNSYTYILLLINNDISQNTLYNKLQQIRLSKGNLFFVFIFVLKSSWSILVFREFEKCPFDWAERFLDMHEERLTQAKYWLLVSNATKFYGWLHAKVACNT